MQHLDMKEYMILIQEIFIRLIMVLLMIMMEIDIRQ